MTHRTWRTALALAALLLGLACFSTKISDILANPRNYEGKQVTVSGTVEGTLNLLVIKGFTLSDGTGELRVATERILPKRGERITVTGTLEQGPGGGLFLREKSSGR